MSRQDADYEFADSDDEFGDTVAELLAEYDSKRKPIVWTEGKARAFARGLGKLNRQLATIRRLLWLLTTAVVLATLKYCDRPY